MSKYEFRLAQEDREKLEEVYGPLDGLMIEQVNRITMICKDELDNMFFDKINNTIVSKFPDIIINKDNLFDIVGKALLYDEKETPTKAIPIDYIDEVYTCENCANEIINPHYNYCPYCGKEIDWSE